MPTEEILARKKKIRQFIKNIKTNPEMKKYFEENQLLTKYGIINAERSTISDPTFTEKYQLQVKKVDESDKEIWEKILLLYFDAGSIENKSLFSHQYEEWLKIVADVFHEFNTEEDKELTFWKDRFNTLFLEVQRSGEFKKKYNLEVKTIDDIREGFSKEVKNEVLGLQKAVANFNKNSENYEKELEKLKKSWFFKQYRYNHRIKKYQQQQNLVAKANFALNSKLLNFYLTLENVKYATLINDQDLASKFNKFFEKLMPYFKPEEKEIVRDASKHLHQYVLESFKFKEENHLYNWEETIKTIIFSEAMQKYCQQVSYHQNHLTQSSYGNKKSKLENKIEKLEAEMLNKSNIKLLTFWREKRLKNYKQLLQKLETKAKHNRKIIRELSLNVRKEIVENYYNNGLIVINEEECKTDQLFQIFQNKLIENCQLLENNLRWKPLQSKLKTLSAIAQSLVTDVASDIQQQSISNSWSEQLRKDANSPTINQKLNLSFSAVPVK